MTSPILTRSLFQSTHSLRSATAYDVMIISSVNVSIHALLAECDPLTPPAKLKRLKFQSTHSLRSATGVLAGAVPCTPVSIHALLAECDRFRHSFPRPVRGFNPRTPCGVRPATGRALETVSAFQSTHSLRSATVPRTGEVETIMVSIHALLAECDSSTGQPLETIESFNPRTPCGVRHKVKSSTGDNP